MNLAFVLYKYFPFGGLQRNMLAIAREARQRGHQVTVYCTEWQGDRDQHIRLELIAGRGWSNAGRMKNFASDVALALRSKNVDLVLGFNKLPGLDLYYAADSCFADKAWGERGFWYRMTPRARCYLAFEAAVFGAKARTHILEVSVPERERFIACYQTPVARFHTLPPGISPDRAAPSDWRNIRLKTRKALGIADGEKILLAVGSGFRTKGLDRSIEALAALTEISARLFVIGDDNNKPFVRLAKRRKVNDRVVFLGGRSDIPSLLQAGDVLLHPAYKENTGNVLLEAMIAGLPVVTTAVCGYAHYVSAAAMGEVITGPFEDVEYVTAIRRVLMDTPETWHRRGELFARTGDIYHRPRVAVDVIETLIGST